MFKDLKYDAPRHEAYLTFKQDKDNLNLLDAFNAPGLDYKSTKNLIKNNYEYFVEAWKMIEQ